MRDDSGIHTIASNTNSFPPHNIDFDPIQQTVYWTKRSFSGQISKVNADGSGKEIIINTSLPSGLRVDAQNSTVYWSAQFENRLMRANLDGTNTVEIFSGTILPSQIVPDARNNQLFFVNTTGSQAQQGAYSIESVSLDGQNRTILIDQLIQVTGFDIDFSRGKLYWVDLGVNLINDTSIKRANLDGSGVETLLSNMSDAIIDFRLDPISQRMYWTSRDDGTIKSSTIDGSSIITEVSGLNAPHGLAVVPVAMSVPEPAALSLMGLGLFVLGFNRRKRLKSFK